MTALQLRRRSVEDVVLFAVIVQKPGLDVEFLAFAPGGRPAVYWTRQQASDWLRELLRNNQAAAGRVELWKVKR
jgi:hypothetical protein